MELRRGFSVGLTLLLTAIMTVTAAANVNTVSVTEEPVYPGFIYIDAADGLAPLGDLDIEVVAVYETFVLAKFAKTDMETLGNRGIQTSPVSDLTTISLCSYRFDTASGEPEIPEALRSEASDSLYILQFIGPVKAAWVDEARALGLDFCHYLPNYAYLVRATQEEIGAAAGMAAVSWTGHYHPAYKIRPGTEGGAVYVDVWNGPDVQETLDAISEICPGAEFSYSETYDCYETVVQADSSAVLAMAQLDDVIWLEPYEVPALQDEIGSEIVGGIWTANTPYGGAGNYANLLGWDGTNVVVGIADTGLGTGATSGNHADFETRIVGGKGYGSLTVWSDGHGHGTHCAGLISADGAGGTGVKYAGTQYYCGMGTAPDSRLYSQKIFTDGGSWSGPSTAADWDTFFQDAYNAGAYVHSNSWGEAQGTGDGMYEQNDIYYDNKVRDSASSTAGQQPLCIVVAAGNSGPNANTVGSPGSAKSVITVGATETYVPNADSYGETSSYASATYANNIDDIASFSGRGLEDDSRIKPDVMAPGFFDLSTHSSIIAGSNLYGLYSLDNRYEWCSGTSQACPYGAGAAAVVTEWYAANNGGTKPMPAMIKALMINTAKDIATADIPNGNEGWGRIYLPEVVSPSANVMKFDNPQLLSTGQTYSVPVAYASSSQPLKATLVWTDPAAAASANPALINNLNIRITAPGGQIWYGNAFASGMSVSGTAASNAAISGEVWDANSDMFDDKNNVECVFIPTAQLQTGTYTVDVIAQNVPTDAVTGGAVDQDFALVLYNAQVPGTTATATGPLGGPTSTTAVTLTYTYSGTPTSVNIYRTANGGSTWTLCGNDATVDGSYSYTISSGSATYGWLASAVGGGSTEPSPPTSGTAPEAASYILDITAPAAPAGLTVQHWGLHPGSVPAVQGFQASNGGTATAANKVLTAPAGITPGELLLIIVSDDYATTASPHFNAVTGWTKIGESGSATPDAYIAAYWRIADGTEGASVTVGSTAAAYWLGWYIRISGADAVAPINSQNFAVSTATGVNPHVIPEITTAAANCLAVYGLSFDGGDGASFSVASPWTESAEQTNGAATTYNSGCWGTKSQATAGATGTASVTCAVTDGAAYLQLAIKPALVGTLADNTMNWTHSGTDVDHYNVYRSDAQAGTYTLIGTSPVGTNTYCDIDRGQADATRWWYRVRAVDAAGNEETNTNSVQEPGMTLPYAISLSGKSANSWVYVSFPSATSGNIQTILNDATAGDGLTTWTVAKWYNIQTPADPWKTYRVGGSANDLATISSTMGVWLWITANGGDQALTLNAYVAPSSTAVTVNLYYGWNMVGYPSMTSRLGSATLPAQADRVSVWQSASPYISDSVPAGVTMSHGNAYWVHVVADCVWTVNP